MEDVFLKNRDLSKISLKFLKQITSIIGTIFLFVFFYVCIEIYVPVNPGSNETIIYTVEKGWGDDEIGDNLEELNIIRSSYFFKFYVISSLKHASLQAGQYNLSPKMSIHQIASKMAKGDVIRDTVVILEGWNEKDIGEYLEQKNICTKDYFISLLNDDYSASVWDFLADKPDNVDLEGYLFPDTYELAKGENCEDVIDDMLVNFGKKLSPELRSEITKQGKSIFDIVTMASMIEKEVKGIDDKKIVSGILWNRLAIDMPLQLDSTVNYVTEKNDPSVTIKDTKIDSPYNTYKYYGLPKGPISNPGMDSIMAAIYPTQTDYLYYLSANGKTIFSETLEQHNAAKAKYLK